uniref:ZZ-type zinc finger-containing protein 3 n=1 Tax=Scleropages formosus TaxID=113540 RepID=A0A8C9RG69_SCLFO
MAASRSTRVTRSSVGINGLDENFCGRTLRNRSIAQSDDSSPAPLPRARSPKKRQESQQHGTPQQASPKGGHHGKVADPKHLQAEREVCSSPRKRGLSFSERECSSKVDNCEIRLARDASPVQKRARCCSRSGEAPEPKEESLAKTEGSACDSREAAENEEGPKAAGLISVRESRDDIDADLGACSKEGNDQPVSLSGDHKVTNGLDEQDSGVAEASCSKPPTSNTECSSMAPEEPCASSAGLLNGGQAVASLILEPDVPCRNSHSEKAEPGGLSALGKQDLPPLPVVAAASSGSPAAEEEVLDVVGEVSGLSQEPAVESTNGGLCTAQDNPCISGEADSQPTGYTDCPADAPSFTEPQEHRYALRTSPRRGKSSPPKLSPPSRDNGLKEEEMGVEPKALGEACPKPEEEAPSRRLASVCPGEVETKASREAVLMEGRTFRSTKENTGVLALAEDEEDEEDPDVYYFESDHLALKHNKDYQRLLQTIGVLEAQRTQAIMDLEALAQHQRKALDDPIGFVERLQKQLVAGVPRPQRVVQLPDIAWEKYTSGLADLEREFCDRKRNTRRMKLVFDKVGLPARPKSPPDSKKEGESSALYSALPSSDAPTHPASTSRVQMIRGRVCDQNKPDTFNQLWTVEEQKKLEQLLLKFPPEEVESKRWQKIADELGNRTAKQVASRVQKYFIKLTKAGIPVPGRTPNMCIYSKKSSSKRQHHLNKHLYRPSTFLTSYEPPVYMDDEDDRSSFYSTMQDSTGVDSDEESIPMECRHLPEYKELLDLKRLKKQKLQEMHAESTVTQHTGYKCDACGVEPIQGVRWHCQDCPPDSSMDFCSSCSECVHVTETHKPDHRLEPVCQAESFLDRDYCLPQTKHYSTNKTRSKGMLVGGAVL